MTARASLQPSPSASAIVDIWTFDLDVPATAELCALLSPDEVQRANRLRRPRDAARFRVAHARLREILARYLATDAAQIAIAADSNGKPFIAAPETLLRFNLSHSDDLGAVAVSRIGEVGVDIERIQFIEGPDLEPLFSASEQAAFAKLSGAERREAFFRCWTRKEALLKAWGHGLTVPIDSFDVPVGPEPDVTVQVVDEMRVIRTWRLISITPKSGYAGAVALDADAAGDVKLRLRAWPASG